MRPDGPCLNGLPIWPRRNRVIFCHSLQLGIEFEGSSPPFLEGDLAPTDSKEPIGRFTLYGQVDTSCSKQLPALKTQPGAVHGVLRVIADGRIQMLPRGPSPSAVSGPTYAQ